MTIVVRSDLNETELRNGDISTSPARRETTGDRVMVTRYVSTVSMPLNEIRAHPMNIVIRLGDIPSSEISIDYIGVLYDIQQVEKR